MVPLTLHIPKPDPAGAVSVDFPDQLPMFVPNEDCAAKIEANYSDDLAVAAEQVFSQPIRIVNVLPMDFSSHQN